jgi:hypothetical protein
MLGASVTESGKNFKKETNLLKIGEKRKVHLPKSS